MDKVFEKLKNSNLEISRIRNPLVIHEESIPRPKRVKLEESLPIKSKEIEIITDLDIIALGTIDIILPPFKYSMTHWLKCEFKGSQSILYMSKNVTYKITNSDINLRLEYGVFYYFKPNSQLIAVS